VTRVVNITEAHYIYDEDSTMKPIKTVKKEGGGERVVKK
jgi:hypothetical protein